MNEHENQPDRIGKSPQSQRPATFKQKREVIGREARSTAILLGIVSFLGQQFTLNGLKDTLTPAIENVRQPGAAAVGDYLTIIEVFWTSAPLAVAVAIIYVLLMKNVLLGAPGLATAAVVLTGAAFIGNELGFERINYQSRYGGTPPGLILSILESYLSAYGIITFISSLIVGIFFGRAYLVLELDE